jgi:predicted CoA-binding protein
VYPSIADVPEWVDIVDVFRNVADVPTVLDEAIAVRAKSLWLQLGLRDDVSANRAVKNGLKVVQNRCLKVDYASLLLKN